MSAKIRVKAAYMDKSSSRFFDNLTPVSTWVEPDLTVAKLLPILTKRFWTVVASEVLDDDEGKNAKPEMVKAVSINFEGSLVLPDDILYDVLVDGSPRSEKESTPSQKDLSIIVGVKGASDYLPETSKSMPGKSPQQQHWKISGQRPQGLSQSQPVMALPGGVTDIQFQNVQFPVLQQSTTPGTSKPGMPNVVPGGGGTQDATNITTLDSSAWANLSNYPNIQLLQSNDGTTLHAVPSVSIGADGILGKRTAGDRDAEGRECPLPFLRDISSVLELYERWELGLEGQKPLKKLQAGQYRLYRTRYHEIKNFVFHMEGRAKNGEGGGDIREVAKKMQLELEDMKTSHGTRMGLPTYVRKTASQHVQSHRTGGSRTITNDAGAQQDGNAATVQDAPTDLMEKTKEGQEQG